MTSAVPSRHPKYRTRLCRNFVGGGCPFGQKCCFVHPAPRTDPPSSLLAQQLFNWNAFLPQLLALSRQQGTLKRMPQRSPPRFQGQLIDEDPSPSTSLLLSTSDCTSEHLPETGRFSGQKKYPCRHFIRTGGWCPAAAQCRFHHDVAALPSTDVPKVEHAPPFETGAHGENERTISGGVLMGIHLPSPTIINQKHPEHRYNEAELVQPYQPMHWPNYTWQPYQPYYAAAPATTAVPVPTTVVPSSAMQYNIYHPPQPPVQAVPSPTEVQRSLPMGAYEVNGTTYFPTQMPSAPAPAPVTYSVPTQPAPYDHTVAPVYPYYAPTLPASYYNVPDQATNTRPQTSFNPFASDPMMPSELPVIPRLEDYQISPIQQDVLPLPISSLSTPGGDPTSTTTTDKPMATQEHDFPYQPSRDQRVGHARRISVNIKKQGRANSG